MVPTSFDESDGILDKPSNMTYEQCDPICVKHIVFQDGFPGVITCWKLTKEEVDELISTGRLWITIMGNVIPPISPTVEKPF